MTLKICDIGFGDDVVSKLNIVATDRTSLYQLLLPKLPKDFVYSWGNFDNSNKRIMEATDIAAMVFAAAHLSVQAVVDEIIITPQLGEL